MKTDPEHERRRIAWNEYCDSLWDMDQKRRELEECYRQASLRLGRALARASDLMRGERGE